MASSDETNELLREIRDLIAEGDDQKYQEYLAKDKENYERYLAKAEELHKSQMAEARTRTVIARPFQWLALGVVVYYAVLWALRNAG